jgi:L-ascorbate metabolism protein UlaG (beta-lactamase superfamily)
MKLKWYGHASFLIQSDDGMTIVTDPYGEHEESGYWPVTENAHVVIRSSATDHFHNRADLIPGNPAVITALEVARNGGEHRERGITVRAMEVKENLKHHNGNPDSNGMYRFTVDGMNIGHMGDVGNPLTEQQIEFFKDVHVLLALTGGYPTIELADLKTAIDIIKPRWVVPMHFRTLTVGPRLRRMLWIQSFLDYFSPDDVDFANDCEVTITPANLPSQTRVLVLDYV